MIHDRKQSSQKQGDEKRGRHEKTENNLPVPKALLVEDSAIFRKLLKETLHSGFPSLEISEAADGEEAMQRN